MQSCSLTMTEGGSSPVGNSGPAAQQQTGVEPTDEPWHKLSSRELRGNLISFPTIKKLKILDCV